MGRGYAFENRVGEMLTGLRDRYPAAIEVERQFPMELRSGREVRIDFRLSVDFPHERQHYYLELQSREKADHALADKIESVRRDTPASTFSFVHEAPIQESVASELKSRNIVAYDLAGFARLIDGIEVQLLQSKVANQSLARQPRDNAAENRLETLVSRLNDLQGKKKERHMLPKPMSSDERGLVDEIVDQVKKNPDAAIRAAKKHFGKFFGG